MSFYCFMDNYSMTVGGAITKKKYFANDVESRRISDWFDVVKLDTPAFDKEGYYPVNVQYEGENSEAAIKVEQWKGPNYPTIIYHHGAAEGSYDYSFNKILRKNKEGIKANLIAIQALFNHSNKEFMDSIPYLSKYTLMLATSALLVEKLVAQIKKTSSEKIIVTGTSLGGLVTCLHFTYFNTADCYKPLLAGPRIAEVFITSAYAKVTSVRGKENPDKLRLALNFQDDLKKREQSKLFPLLAKEDQIMAYEVQSADYDPEHVTVIPYGHATGALKFKLLRDYIIDGIK